jgi:hypothetical protein
MSVVLRNLDRISVEHETQSKLLFFQRLRTITNQRKGAVILASLLERKQRNRSFHAFENLKKKPTEAPVVPNIIEHRSIFPLQSSRLLENIPLLFSLDRPHLGKYAGLGRVVGVLLSVIRLWKLEAFRLIASRSNLES